jgi:hypothetical protein
MRLVTYLSSTLKQNQLVRKSTKVSVSSGVFFSFRTMRATQPAKEAYHITSHETSYSLAFLQLKI